MRAKKTVDLNAIKANYENVKALAGGRRVMCVLKADAYGHGAVRVAEFLRSKGGYAVATVDEAMALKNAVPNDTEILILGKVEKCDIPDCVNNGVSVTVDNIAELTYCNEIAERMHKEANVHIAVNTGMNRIGVKWSEPPTLIKAARTLGSVKLKGVYSHIYSRESALLQNKRFNSYLSGDKEKNYLTHLAATQTLCDENIGCDMVRVGIGLYGYGLKNAFPAMGVKCRVLSVNRLIAGDIVGYDGRYIAKKEEFSATLSIGYADGLMRSYTGGEVIIGGKKRKIIGNVCMDMCFALVDEKVHVGDEAVIIGAMGDKQITAEDVALKANTIPYEVLTSFKRMETEYIAGGHSVFLS